MNKIGEIEIGIVTDVRFNSDSTRLISLKENGEIYCTELKWLLTAKLIFNKKKLDEQIAGRFLSKHIKEFNLHSAKESEAREDLLVV